MKIHQEGYTLIVFFLLLSISLGLLIHYWIPFPTWVKLLPYAALTGFMVFIFRFFRYRLRDFVPDSTSILCPADGKIVVIEEVEKAEYFGDRRIQVSIFMSPNDIHVNWMPISGEVVSRVYYPGKYLVAWHPKSSLENERTSVVIRTDAGKEILVRQIAGAVARRIVCYAAEGQQASQGEELGFIKFGSRVDLLLPTEAVIHVAMRQRVFGRQTRIASLGA
jgi:phosphatidylserine decarboxylase